MKGKINPALKFWLATWGTEGLRKTGLEYPSITQEGKLLTSPGRGSGHKPRSPHYEPSEIVIAVDKAMGEVEELYYCLLHARYREGYSDRVIALHVQEPTGRVSWWFEKAHRDIAKALKIKVYR